MSHRSPYFSVIMPTYNRAQFLPLAIQSVLDQSFSDFELIISNGGSTDNTKDVVAGFNDPRIRYLESQEKLSIGDNYQTAFDHAGGEFITFLGDDDAFVPTMFEQVGRIINERQAEIVSFKYCHYYHDEYVETDKSQIPANSLFVPEHTNDLEEFDTKRAIELLFNIHGLNQTSWNRKFSFPVLANAVYHHKIFSRIKQKNKHLFALTPADMYLAAAVFYVTETYYCLDKPLLVWSRWSGNSTASPQKKGKGLRRHYENLLNGNSLENTPLKFPLPFNCCINAVLQAKNDFDDKTKLDWKLYYKSIYNDLLFLREIGGDVSEEREEFERVLTACSTDFQREVRAEISGSRFSIKEMLKSKMPTAVNILRRIINRELPVNLTVSGSDAGFNNVLEAARYLQRLPENL